jgi:hypothetical protein
MQLVDEELSTTLRMGANTNPYRFIGPALIF